MDVSLVQVTFWGFGLVAPLLGYFLGRVRDQEQGIPRGPGFWHLRFYFCKYFGICV
jgi:hypothetical protein